MIGMDFFYADQQVQCPSDDEVARAIVRLIDAGLADRILLSHDVFLKMMLTRYGGNGYAFVTRHFLPRLAPPRRRRGHARPPDDRQPAQRLRRDRGRLKGTARCPRTCSSSARAG